MFNKIILKGRKDAADFVWAAAKIPADVYLTTHDRRYKVNGKSTLGVLLALTEWNDDLWVETEGAAYNLLEKFIEVADDDNASIHE